MQTLSSSESSAQQKNRHFFHGRFGLAAVILLAFSIFVSLVLKHSFFPINQTAFSGPPSPTPFPYAELTIPYLRQRKYQSELGERERLARNDSYETFLTSYQSDGLRIQALLTIPITPEPEGGWPAIVFVHGYIPPDQYDTEERYQAYVDALAKSGLVVLKIDLRGHGDSEGIAGGAYFSSDYVIDTLNARAALQSASFVNPEKVGLWGHSMAGNVVLRSAVAQPEIPAIVIWAGAVFTYSDLQEFGIQDQSYQRPRQESPSQQRRQALFDMHGQFDPESLFWQQVVPTNYLNDLQGAVQMHYAADDAVVSIQYGQNLNQLLDKTQISHELHEYPQGGHNLTGSTFSLAMQRTIEFYKKNLSNE